MHRRRMLVAMALAVATLVPWTLASGEPSFETTITVGQGPSLTAVDPRTHRVLVTNTLDNTVSVLSTARITPLATVRVG
jgi:hypothetical protein